MRKSCIFAAQRRNYVTNNKITKNKAGIGASQNGVTSLFLHPRPHFFYLQNSDKMQQHPTSPASFRFLRRAFEKRK